MQKLVSELTRLYLPTAILSPEVWEQQLSGQSSGGVNLVTADGRTRAMAIPFDKQQDTEDAQHWNQLCLVANALQDELRLPAPAVSISGAHGYCLWLSFEMPVSTVRVEEFLELLRTAYFPGMALCPEAEVALPELPPSLHLSTGKWAAFIHPGLGASFADESGLEMAPPFAGQAALLENLKSISEPVFSNAINVLRQAHVATLASKSASEGPSTARGVLLKDATLEEIVAHLHSKNIEPTFRHLIRE
ncbi:MAG: hypothetical protein M3R60_17550 [Pseudomonadota bacterium]|nr:hypothetical protein [Pseudomonadota bacterium]